MLRSKRILLGRLNKITYCQCFTTTTSKRPLFQSKSPYLQSPKNKFQTLTKSYKSFPPAYIEYLKTLNSPNFFENIAVIIFPKFLSKEQVSKDMINKILYDGQKNQKQEESLENLINRPFYENDNYLFVLYPAEQVKDVWRV